MTDFDLDMTMMFAVHDALRRDVARMASLGEPTEGWDLFARMLHVHHTAEDDLLWPLVRENAATVEDTALLDRMVDEHAAIGPAVDAMARALTQGESTAAAHAELASRLIEHLEHEERDALPLIDRALTDDQWMAFGQAAAQRVGPDMPRYLPWVLEGADDDMAERLLAVLPPPMRQTYFDEWLPAFTSHDRWTTPLAA